MPCHTMPRIVKQAVRMGQWATCTNPHLAWHAHPHSGRRYAWGSDELDAAGQRPRLWMNVGLTIVDGLDTLLIMGLDDEVAEARQWVANHFDLGGRGVSVGGWCLVISTSHGAVSLRCCSSLWACKHLLSAA